MLALTSNDCCLDSEREAQLCCHSPWRKNNPQTAAQIRKGLVYIFRHVAARSWWNSKCKKFEPPDRTKKREYADEQRNAA